jgi:DNA modification methylase
MKKLPINHGDIFQLGRHRLACGDCHDVALVSRLTGKDRIALVLTDPPYGVNYVEGKEEFTKTKPVHAAIQNDHYQTDDEFRSFTRTWLEAARPHLTPKNAAYIFISDKMLFALRDGMLDAGWRYGQLLLWVKTQAVIGRLDYAVQHECIVYGWNGVHAFYKSPDRSVIIYPKPKSSPFHPTTKPIPILRRLILNSSRINDVVYDPFLGSGSTLLAAEQTQRRCLGIEIEEGYCRVILERFEKLTGIAPEKLPTPRHD